MNLEGHLFVRSVLQLKGNPLALTFHFCYFFVESQSDFTIDCVVSSLSVFCDNAAKCLKNQKDKGKFKIDQIVTWCLGIKQLRVFPITQVRELFAPQHHLLCSLMIFKNSVRMSIEDAIRRILQNIFYLIESHVFNVDEKVAN